MVSAINILWIKPQDSQLKLIPGENSPLKGVIPDEGIIVSYDNQRNYPYTTQITVARELQSAMKCIINASFLNLSAVPKNLNHDGLWENKYLGKQYKEIPFGKSKIELRRIGLDISQVPDFEKIVEQQDVVVIPISFETHVPEVMRLNEYIKSRFGNKPIINTGTGIESHEEQLLGAGADIAFHGTISDKADEVLTALLEKDYKRLAQIPGVHTNLAGLNARNVGARNFRRNPHARAKEITSWREKLSKYHAFSNVNIKMVGRPDLKISQTDDLLSYCNSFQDLDTETAEAIIGKEVIFAADRFFLQVDCPRECDFCVSGGRGAGFRNFEYSAKLIEYYAKLGANALIPSDDQVLLPALNQKMREGLLKTFEVAKEKGVSFFFGNGLETWAFYQIISKSRYGVQEEIAFYQKLLDAIMETTSYFYLPYESIFGLSDTPKLSELRKLDEGRNAFLTVFDYINKKAEEKGIKIEVGTNIILTVDATEDQARTYYRIMDEITAQFPNLNVRYNTFFMVPSNCAPHIVRLRQYGLYSEQYPELKIVALPQIMQQGETTFDLEKKYAWNLKAAMNSKSYRRLSGGTYSHTKTVTIS